jgi:hypothetical protein
MPVRLLAHKDRQAHKVMQGRQEARGLLDQQVQLDLQGRKAHKVFKVLPVLQGHKVFRAYKVNKVFRVSQGQLEHKAYKA